ncbi:hypothetical protein CJF31_00002371 [Rutstroemia sp. NJR-2017a BVV2]|nr:hypothetical protein CJF31_00002371 [Rutstroemia sp. NJR-2017a BVV2]
MTNFLQQVQKTTDDTRKRTADLENVSIEQPRKKHLGAQDQPCEQIEKQNHPRENESSQARIDFWRRNGTWPTAEQEETIDGLRNLV